MTRPTLVATAPAAVALARIGALQPTTAEAGTAKKRVMRHRPGRVVFLPTKLADALVR